MAKTNILHVSTNFTPRTSESKVCDDDATHVSIQLMITRPLTILHRLKASAALPQLIGRVRAVSDAEPMRKRRKAMVTGMMCDRSPKARWWPRKMKPGIRMTGG